MANSTTNIDQISESMADKEEVVNEYFDAASPALAFGRRASTTSALTWGYYGGTIDIAGEPTQIANGTVTLTASDTNYIYLSSAGVVTQTITEPTGWPGPITSPADAKALYEIVTGASSVTSYTDYRNIYSPPVDIPTDFVGDSGSGGTAGLVPAPAAGDGADGLVLLANGQWGRISIPSGTLSSGTQAYLGSRYIQWGSPQGNQYYEVGPLPVTNTATSTTGTAQTASNYYTQVRWLRLTSNTAVNSQAGQHWTTVKLWRGNASGLGGFLCTFIFGADSWHSDGRWAVGMRGTATLPGTTTEPSTLTDSFLIGQDSTDTNIQVMTHDGSSGSTKTTLGGSFPRPTGGVSVYEVTLSCQPNASTLEYSIINHHSGTAASGSVSTNLPTSSTFMFPFRYSNNGPTTTGSVDFCIGVNYFETTY